MKTSLDCIPCFVRQALDSARLVSDDPGVHEAVLREVLRAAAEMDLACSPPVMGQRIHRLIRQCTGNGDPYRPMKERFNRLATAMYPGLHDWVARSAAPLETAVRLAIAGNVIDFGVRADLAEADVHEGIEHALAAPLNGDVADFAAAVRAAGEILYLADNAGEIVFDRLLIEQMPRARLAVAVKGSPVLNDATLADARATGLTDLVEVIDNGSDAPGTILADCSRAFRRRFDRADLVVSKGQGNYETLSDVRKDVFFVLKAKCPVISRRLACEVGSLVLRRSSPAPSPARRGARPVDAGKEQS